MNKNKYYVYQVIVGVEVVYFGKGQGERYRHSTSGKSHNYNLNLAWFEHVLLGYNAPIVEIIKRFNLEEDALDYEMDKIITHLPKFNIVGTKGQHPPSILNPMKVVSNRPKVNIPSSKGGITKEQLSVIILEGYQRNNVKYKTLRSFIKNTFYHQTKRGEEFIAMVVELCLELTGEDIKVDGTILNGGRNKAVFKVRYDVSKKEGGAINNFNSTFRKKYSRNPTEQEMLTELNRYRNKQEKKIR